MVRVLADIVEEGQRSNSDAERRVTVAEVTVAELRAEVSLARGFCRAKTHLKMHPGDYRKLSELKTLPKAQSRQPRSSVQCTEIVGFIGTFLCSEKP